ncbi:gliding motility-associated peptidyl-prolyl isomerase GldI [Candidatus Ulvibacter alkanivorans]|uniref:gliding motility-associated peptidyl-prolyl isomerase GldI n=1 Tax=Candidatus Ulvibacter alkanivorans TaxID=2267620 RepID=UPI000DF3A0E9|nr:gliding motility-associated peptidyl-prolyl isomerase GldI [Candidatus Ulvibacter alkanivorans]
MIRNFLYLLFFCSLILACKSPEARKPVKQSSGTFIEESVERNKKIYEAEKQEILKVMENRPENSYLASDSGFWYYYNSKDSTATTKPDFGDKITFTYNIKELDGTVVLSEEENGLQVYKVDQSNQDLISGIRDGVKLMKPGETVTFLFPSYKAYGYYGIQNKLGANTPVQSTITLKSIEQIQEN